MTSLFFFKVGLHYCVQNNRLFKTFCKAQNLYNGFNFLTKALGTVHSIPKSKHEEKEASNVLLIYKEKEMECCSKTANSSTCLFLCLKI